MSIVQTDLIQDVNTNKIWYVTFVDEAGGIFGDGVFGNKEAHIKLKGTFKKYSQTYGEYDKYPTSEELKEPFLKEYEIK